jgi:hypothetical protein
VWITATRDAFLISADVKRNTPSLPPNVLILRLRRLRFPQAREKPLMNSSTAGCGEVQQRLSQATPKLMQGSELSLKSQLPPPGGTARALGRVAREQ